MGFLAKTILKRFALGILTLFFVSVVVFSCVATLPGGFAEAVLGQSATPEAIASFNQRLGLDRPPIERYLSWAAAAVQGDFGSSYASEGGLGGHTRTVASLIAPRLANTLFLAAFAALIAVPTALFFGTVTAIFRNSIFDRVVNVFSLSMVSVPDFFVAYVLMLFLSVKFDLFPSLSVIDTDTTITQRLYLCFLPALTIVVVSISHMMRMTRSSIINLLSTPYIEMARLKGVSPARVILHHALPNAWAPISAVIALNLAYLIAGVVVVEVVFVYPGIGQLMVSSVFARDIPVVQACALVFALVYILFNLLADLVGIITNPRLLHSR